jgi:putative chitinase
MLTESQLARIMPRLTGPKRERYLPLLNAAMREFGITTPARQAAFLAQLAHESSELRFMEEIASGAAYEGRADLGNTRPGDGAWFKGRGPIQLTGRANYAHYGARLGVDLLHAPTLTALPGIAFRVAALFWRDHGLNALADQGRFKEITRRINGGQLGAASRRKYYLRARKALIG